jgi:16S rRNA (cytosine967-C5)-methyltransferase
LLEWNNHKPPLVIQPARWSRVQLEAALTAAGIGFRPAPFDAGLVVEATRPTTLPGFAEGGFIVQDPAQRVVARFFDPDPASTIYDACAAPGGKAIALLETARFVVAADRTAPRVRKLAETIARAGDRRVAAVRADVTQPAIRPVDAVVLDVPCLGTGAFARNPDARWRVSADALERLAKQAAGFLAAAAEVVRPGGLLLFATCSLEPLENEIQIARFLDGDHRFRREPSSAVPAELLSEAGDLILLPQRTGTDGGFAARLRKTLQ